MPTPIDEYDTRLETARDHIDQQLAQATDAFNVAFDRQALFQLASRAAEVGRRLPEAVSIFLIDWCEEVAEGEPFDVDLVEVFDADDNQIDDVGGVEGAFPIRHHWTIDQLRVDPEAGGDDMYHPANRISIAKAAAWLERQFDQQPTGQPLPVT